MIVVSGYRGTVGSALMRGLGDVVGYDAADLAITEGQALVHGAIDWRSARESLTMNLNAFADWQGDRILFISSVNADPEANGTEAAYRFGDYGAMKLASEAFLRAWVNGQPGRTGVALRLGAFGHDGDRQVRTTERGLMWWTQRALAASPGFHVWTATGDGG